MPSIHSEATKLDPSALVSLFQLDATEIGGLTHNFTTETRAGAAISFGGTTFTSVPIQISGMTVSGQGALQTPTLSIANTDGLIQQIVNTWGDLEGARLTRWRTFARFLDGGTDPDGSAFYGPDVFIIDRKSSDTPEQIQWELSALIDKQGVYIGRTVIRDTCLWRYRTYRPASGNFDYSKAQCPYAGSNYFDENNVATADPAKDRPARNLECCRKRFGQKAVLPFGGFPGIVRGLQ
ncbi:phage minor tail protein L [Paracoccus litorisediminis]|uniref:Phage minor tail protein L n=1 Tax=Paracoccus litorisediminis TaxID=2006130 RepID=A0A844HS96_9RHOB|nr:phage minor tail protein L [Paracoccus litorisediminis]MTH61207.1 phage minor tail protein L [Paracoccus litorisediminis]